MNLEIVEKEMWTVSAGKNRWMGGQGVVVVGWSVELNCLS